MDRIPDAPVTAFFSNRAADQRIQIERDAEAGRATSFSLISSVRLDAVIDSGILTPLPFTGMVIFACHDADGAARGHRGGAGGVGRGDGVVRQMRQPPGDGQRRRRQREQAAERMIETGR